ncbi:DUF1573 domain-containing protein [Mesoflavibacter zeaxanthinifaciens]|uniref:DUF1573 domain-containing protein n=1 Tax=Mesoflavibacter zeaxanthinifaciens TaxID=393060 RepID=UPI0026F10C83|nr:DUF1573 domain-containing protein [Mesoflavibacter zeaxanthinifaciens]
MKNFIVLLLLVSVFSCKNHSNSQNKKVLEDEEEFEEQIYSEISIKNQDFDFGKIQVNDTVKNTYTIKNISEEPLLITKIISNCNCINFDYPKSKLLKDEEMLISTQFIADQNNLGSVNILMLIECNIKKGVEVISMSGYVSDDKE